MRRLRQLKSCWPPRRNALQPRLQNPLGSRYPRQGLKAEPKNCGQENETDQTSKMNKPSQVLIYEWNPKGEDHSPVLISKFFWQQGILGRLLSSAFSGPRAVAGCIGLSVRQNRSPCVGYQKIERSVSGDRLGKLILRRCAARETRNRPFR